MNKQNVFILPTALDLSLLTQLASETVSLTAEQKCEGAAMQIWSKYNLRDHQGTLSFSPAQCLRAIRAHEVIVIGLCSG